METCVLKITEEINKLICCNNDLKKKETIMRSIPGVGQATAAMLLSEVRKLGEIDHKKIAAIIGVAPYTNQSGNYLGHASIYGGRSEPRWILYMATLSAIRYNPMLKEFYERLKNAGKEAKVAIVACMRKLITIINAMIRSGTVWKHA